MTSAELKALRKRSGFSQFRLAILTGVSRFKISLAECGYEQLKKDELARLTGVLRKKPTVGDRAC